MVVRPRASVMVIVASASSLKPDPSEKFSSAWLPAPVFIIAPAWTAVTAVISTGLLPGSVTVTLPFTGVTLQISDTLFRSGSMFRIVARPLAIWARVAGTSGAKLFFRATVNRPACNATAICCLAQCAGWTSTMLSDSVMSPDTGMLVRRKSSAQASARLTGSSGLNVPSG
ncbi:MAG: hypothetical protein A4E56_03278 [Pelotomaculum sp. PtaU1.Bin065]|nr:MAG: hypothetical protein A4E56_03278 [Pelotomaculum sp. PtaU1.Bin065]